MKGMLKGVIFAVVALVLFAVSIVGFLKISGRLDQDGMSSLPVVGRYFDEEDEAPLGLPDGSVSLAEASAKKQGEEKKAMPTAEQSRRKTIFNFKSFEALDPPTSREEIVEFYRLAKEGKQRLDQREAQLERRSYQLELLEADLEERRISLEKMMNSIRSEKDKVQAAYDEYKASWMTMKKTELPRMKRTASIIANMEPKTAADHLLEMLPGEMDKAVKFLTLMEPEAASEILTQMDPDKGAKLILRSTQILQGSGK